ncbi:hypothetical protein C8J57DRAFT_1538020 [Mycena rebaudengoi]|nr:hypothetical protein C8J57DRAFT_1538020 [Mycena rebaudengoi]
MAIQTDKAGDFYTKVAKIFINKYGWLFDITGDIDDCEDPDDDTEELVDEDVANLDETLAEKYFAYYTMLRMKIGQWYRYHYRKTTGTSGDNLVTLFQNGEASEALSRPKARQLLHVYSGHYYKSHVKNTFDMEWEWVLEVAEEDGETPPTQINVRNRVTKECWQAETEEFRAMVVDLKRKEDDAAQDAWEKEQTAEEEVQSAEDYDTALRHAAVTLQPLADAAAKRYGMAVSILLVGPIGEKGERVHSGTTCGAVKKNWPQADPAGFSGVVTSMLRFGILAFSQEECDACALTTPSTTTSAGSGAAWALGASAPPETSRRYRDPHSKGQRRRQLWVQELRRLYPLRVTTRGACILSDWGRDVELGWPVARKSAVQSAGGDDAGADHAGADHAGADDAGADDAGADEQTVEPAMTTPAAPAPPTRESTPVTPAPPLTPPTPPSRTWEPRTRTGWPEELGRVYDAFEKAGAGWGDGWELVVDVYIVIEEASGFPYDRVQMAAGGRPSIIARWMQLGRKLGFAPSFYRVTLVQFKADFWSWWRGIQPAARLDEAGEAMLWPTDLEWGPMRDHSGKNGLVQVLLSRRLQRQGGPETADGAPLPDGVDDTAEVLDWELVVNDVRWALWSMVDSGDFRENQQASGVCGTSLRLQKGFYWAARGVPTAPGEKETRRRRHLELGHEEENESEEGPSKRPRRAVRGAET